MAIYKDPARFEEAVTMTSTVDLTNATLIGQRALKTLSIPFVLADITAGSKASAGLPTNALILGSHTVITTPLTFTGTDTTGVTGEIGNTDTDGFGVKVAIEGVAGIKRNTLGALVGSVQPGSTGNAKITFAATGPAADLADVTAGAGTAYVHYADMA